MRAILVCLLISQLAACAANNELRTVNLDPATFSAICGIGTAGQPSPPVTLTASTNSPIFVSSVSCGAAKGPALPEYQKVDLTFAESGKGLARPNVLILVSTSRLSGGSLSTELVDKIKIHTSVAGMARVVMLEQSPLTGQGIYLGYAYP